MAWQQGNDRTVAPVGNHTDLRRAQTEIDARLCETVRWIPSAAESGRHYS